MSLTGGKGTWGNQLTYATPNGGSEIVLQLSQNSVDLGDYLGESLALHNNILVAGARGDYSIDEQYTYSGNAYLLAKTSDGWVYKRLIPNPTPSSTESFGVSADVYNGNIIIGANYAQVNGSSKGEVNIYNYDSNTDNLSSPYTLVANDGSINDSYGTAVASTTIML